MAQHDRLKIDAGIQVYFCDPQIPWQRGTSENTNGLLRQYFPPANLPEILERHPLLRPVLLIPPRRDRRKQNGRLLPIVQRCSQGPCGLCAERAAWKASQPEIGIHRVVFIEETGASNVELTYQWLGPPSGGGNM